MAIMDRFRPHSEDLLVTGNQRGKT